MARWAVDWTISGSFEVEAASAAEASEKFEKAWSKPKGIMPERDGDVVTANPYPVKE